MTLRRIPHERIFSQGHSVEIPPFTADTQQACVWFRAIPSDFAQYYQFLMFISVQICLYLHHSWCGPCCYSLTAVTNSVICSEKQCVHCSVRSSVFPHSTSFTSYHRDIDGNILIPGNISVAVIFYWMRACFCLFILIVLQAVLKYFVYTQKCWELTLIGWMFQGHSRSVRSNLWEILYRCRLELSLLKLLGEVVCVGARGGSSGGGVCVCVCVGGSDEVTAQRETEGVTQTFLRWAQRWPCASSSSALAVFCFCAAFARMICSWWSCSEMCFTGASAVWDSGRERRR